MYHIIQLSLENANHKKTTELLHAPVGIVITNCRIWTKRKMIVTTLYFVFCITVTILTKFSVIPCSNTITNIAYSIVVMTFNMRWNKTIQCRCQFATIHYITCQSQSFHGQDLFYNENDESIAVNQGNKATQLITSSSTIRIIDQPRWKNSFHDMSMDTVKK